MRQRKPTVAMVRILDSFLLELKYGLRICLRSNGFTAAAILTLALGIGANTALFSIVYGVVLRPLDFRDSARLVAITAERDFSGRPRPVQTNFSLPDLEDWQAQARTFESFAMSAASDAAIVGADGLEVIGLASVTPSFFATLDGRLVVGRPIGPADDELPVVVISSRLWQRRFAGSPTVAGQQLVIDRHPYTIVGVAAPTFQVPRRETDAWRPVGFARTLNPMLADRRAGGFQPIARLKPGISLEEARADCRNVASYLRAAYPDRHGGVRIGATRLRDRGISETVRSALFMLFAAVGLVLFVACANVTNLILARNAVRSREVAVRIALGASRKRLVAQSMVLSGLIAVGGAAAGVVLAVAIVSGIVVMQPAGLPRLDAVRVDTAVLSFAVALAALTTAAVGILPAFQSAGSTAALRIGGGHAAGTDRARLLRRALIVAEIAVSVTLLVGASLLARSFVRLIRTDIGVSAGHVSAALIDTSFGRTITREQQRALIERVVDRIRTLPGVVSAGAGASMPPNLARLRFTMRRVDEAVGQPTNYLVDAVTATPGYFSTLGIRLQKGRLFAETDDDRHPQVMIMTASTARQIFADADPIGRTMGLPSGRPGSRAEAAVVGIIDDVKYSGLDKSPDGVIYRPFAQEPWPSMFVVARTDRDLAAFASTLRTAITEVDTAIVVQSVDTLDGLVSDAAAQPRFRAMVLVGMALLAIALAAVGLYAVVAYSVAQRTVEIGIRMALGAEASDVTKLVLREGWWMGVVGIAAGLFAAALLTRLTANLLYGVAPTDPISFALAAGTLLTVTLVASYVPARRAARLDPLAAIRTE